MVEAFIEEGFLSYRRPDVHGAGATGELAGITEEQAEEMIAFAEEAAERRGDEAEAAKAEAAEAETPGDCGSAGRRRRPRPQCRGAHLFKEQPARPSEAKPTTGKHLRPRHAAKPRTPNAEPKISDGTSLRRGAACRSEPPVETPGTGSGGRLVVRESVSPGETIGLSRIK